MGGELKIEEMARCPLCEWLTPIHVIDELKTRWFLCNYIKCKVYQFREDGAVRLFGYPNIVVRIVEVKASK